MNLELYIERIENYLAGELPAGERAAFEQELQSNDELRQALELYRIGEQAIELEVENNLRRELQKWAAEDAAGQVVERQTGARIVSMRTNWVRWAAAAAVFAGAIFFVWFWVNRQPSDEALFAQNYELAPPPAFRSAVGDEHPLAQGFEAYENENYQAAADFFQTISAENERFAEAQFYLGHAAVQLENYDLAISSFDRSAKAGDEKYREKAEWNLLLAYLAAHRAGEEFEALLRKLAGDENHSFHAQAQTLVQKRR